MEKIDETLQEGAEKLANYHNLKISKYIHSEFKSFLK